VGFLGWKRFSSWLVAQCKPYRGLWPAKSIANDPMLGMTTIGLSVARMDQDLKLYVPVMCSSQKFPEYVGSDPSVSAGQLFRRRGVDHNLTHGGFFLEQGVDQAAR
jgi:hypothetical protein